MRWRDIEKRCTDLTKWYADLAALSGETADGLARLRAEIDTLPGTSLPAEPSSWQAARSADRQRDLTALAWWVAWLINAYDLSERWPACWYRHEGLVEMLRALRRWHLALRKELASDPKAATAWHERAVPHRRSRHRAGDAALSHDPSRVGRGGTGLTGGPICGDR